MGDIKFRAEIVLSNINHSTILLTQFSSYLAPATHPSPSLPRSRLRYNHEHFLMPPSIEHHKSSIQKASSHETMKAKLPSTLPVVVEPVLRSSACSPSLPRQLVRGF